MNELIESRDARDLLPETVRCLACGAPGLRSFARSRDIPVNNARIFLEQAEAQSVPVGSLELALCSSCGFIQNVRFDESLVTYDGTYEEQQSFSPTFNAFADTLAADLVERWGLHGKRVIEIGCGKGDFLAKVCELGGNDGIGIDPTVVPSRLRGEDAGRVELRREFYGPQTGPLKADAVLCRHTLEHIRDVGDFVATLRRSLEDSPDVRIFMEVPDASRVLYDAAFWDVYYEHCSYFTTGSFSRLFEAHGFIVDDVRLGFDDQYVLLEGRLAPSGSAQPRPKGEDDRAAIAAAAEGYAARVEAFTENWGARVRATRARGGKVAVWGSGSKCVAFLSETGLESGIDTVVDVNPHRQGRFLPQSGMEVAAPASLVDLRPDLIIVMNAAYLGEIRASLAELGLDPVVEAVG